MEVIVTVHTDSKTTFAIEKYTNSATGKLFWTLDFNDQSKKELSVFFNSLSDLCNVRDIIDDYVKDYNRDCPLPVHDSSYNCKCNLSQIAGTNMFECTVCGAIYDMSNPEPTQCEQCGCSIEHWLYEQYLGGI